MSSNLLLCDCPGLVFPTFVSTKADLVCSGILPIDQMRDHLAPTALVCQNIPRKKLEETYGIYLPVPEEGEEKDRPPFAHELLSAYACALKAPNAGTYTCSIPLRFLGTFRYEGVYD